MLDANQTALNELQFAWAIPHLYLQSGILIEWSDRLQRVGHLESFVSDWARLQSDMPGLPTTTSNPTTHISSSDPYGDKAQLARVLKLKPDLLAGLCYLRMPDYMCFNYNHTACNDIILLPLQRRLDQPKVYSHDRVLEALRLYHKVTKKVGP